MDDRRQSGVHRTVATKTGGDLMKVKLAALAALAAFGSSAYAQSSVTLYGIVDAGLLYQSTSAASFSPTAKDLGHVYRYKDGGIYSSLWGIKGTEDIGGGYTSTSSCRARSTAARQVRPFRHGGRRGAVQSGGDRRHVRSVRLSSNTGRQIVPMAYAMADTDVRSASTSAAF